MVTLDFNLNVTHIFCAFVGDTLFSVFDPPPDVSVVDGACPDVTTRVYRYGNFAAFWSDLQPVLSSTHRAFISEAGRDQVLNSSGEVVEYIFDVYGRGETHVNIPVASAALRAERQIPFCRAGVVVSQRGIVSSIVSSGFERRVFHPSSYPDCYSLCPLSDEYLSRQEYGNEVVESPTIETKRLLTNLNSIAAREVLDLLILETAAPNTNTSNPRIFAAANVLGGDAYFVESPAVAGYPALTYRAANGVSVVEDANASAVFFGVNVADTTPP